MGTKTKAVAWALIALSCCGVGVLGGCGGGGGGGDDDGSGGLPGFLSLAQTVYYGSRQGGVDTLQVFPMLPATGVPIPPGGTNTVPAAQFTSGPPGRQDFIQLSFNNLVNASTITSNPPAGTDGIVIFRSVETATPGVFVSTPVRYSLDATGILDPGNAFPSPNTAPATLRLYVDSDGDLTTPETFTPSSTTTPPTFGRYSLTINQNLRSFNGGPFCTNATGSNCVNTYLPILPFSVDTDSTPLSMNQGTPTVPTQNDPNVPINSEIVLNFDKSVDFVSLVGQVTTRDPFISLPRPVAYVPDCTMPMAPPSIAPFANIGNLYVDYRRPSATAGGAPELPPANLGYVAYMPDPLLNPTQVRIRFVNLTGLVGTETATAFQNYGSNPSKLPITSNDPALNNAVLTLPPILPVPGSLTGYNPAQGASDPRGSIVDVAVMSSSFVAPNGSTCYGAVGVGAADRNGNGFAFNATTADFVLRFIWAVGPSLAKNPMGADAIYIGSQQAPFTGIGVINTAATTTDLGAPGSNTQVPITYGTFVTGNFSLSPNRLMNLGVLGTPKDIEVGAFLLSQTLPSQITNEMTNGGRGATVSGVPDAQNGTTPTSVWCIVNPLTCPGPPVQPWGQFLYVVDGDANSLKVFNSYNLQLITTIAGLGSPEGLGIAPNLEFLYVSNFNQGTVTRIVSNPASPNFHTISGTFTVGAGPSAVSVQPTNEDVFVANLAGNSFSIIDASTQQVRANFADPAAIGPSEIFITHRMLGMGLTNAYSAYILNFFSDNVTVYESDSPAVPENSLQGVVKANIGGFEGPRRGCWNWQTYIGGTTEPGCFVVNVLGDSVDEFTMQNFTLSPTPNFPGPAGIRVYHTHKSYTVPGSVASDAAIDTNSGLFNLNALPPTLYNNKGYADPALGGGGVPSLVLVAYASAGIVRGFDYNTSALISQASVPGCDFLHAYYDQ